MVNEIFTMCNYYASFLVLKSKHALGNGQNEDWCALKTLRIEKNQMFRQEENQDPQRTGESSAMSEKELNVDGSQLLSIIKDFAIDLIQLSSRDELIWHVVEKVAGQAGFVDCVIYLYDETRHVLVQQAAFGDKRNEKIDTSNAIEIALGQGITGRVAVDRKPVIIHDTRHHSGYIADLKSMSSEICVPILHEDRLFGVIDCEHPTPNYFTDLHLEMLTTIATMLASRIAQWEVLDKLTQSQKELSESEEKYRLLFETSDDPMMVLTENNFDLCNEAAAAVFGYRNRAEMQAIHPSVVSPEFQPDGNSSYEKAERMMRLAIEKGHHKFEWVHQKKCGEDFPMDVTLTRIPYQGGTALFAVCRDITERKEAMTALTEAMIEATSANKAKSDFLANMSHELRTPLNAIIGFSEMMTRQVFGALGDLKYETYAQDILGSGKYLLNLIDDILDLAAIDALERKISKTQLDVLNVVDECHILVDQFLREKKQNCQRDIPADISPVYADERALKQILVNLVTNAVKFTPEGGAIKLTVRQEGRNHVFQLADTGQGIAAHRLARITDRFDRGSLDPFKAVEGTGLGLAIVKSLVELHKGSLKIESQEGVGTTVTFRIPLGEETS